MARKNLSELTDEELLDVAKKTKANPIVDSVIFGFLIGVAIYSIFNHGFGLLTFLPLAYIPVVNMKKKKVKELEALLKERNLK
jgi:uncharacterized membrane protein YobD (UPF0266 family)